MKKTTRFLAVLLAVVLLCGLLPVPVLAAGGEYIPVASYDIGEWSAIPDVWKTSFTHGSDPIIVNDGYLHFSENSYSVSSVANTSALEGLNQYTISFDAKIGSFTAGPGSSGSDYSTLAMQLLYADRRLMFAIEESGVRASSAGAAWGTTLNYPDGFDKNAWHTWSVKVSLNDNTAVVSADGEVLGTAYLQGVSLTARGIKFYCRGGNGFTADAFLTNLKIVDDETGQTALQENFSALSAAWARSGAGAAAVNSSYLQLSDGAYGICGMMNGTVLDGLEQYRISFDARIEQFTAGPGPSGSDYNTLGIQALYSDRRMMLTIEKSGIRASSADATWGTTIPYPDGFNPAVWHTYAIDVNKKTGAVTVSADGVQLGTAALQGRGETVSGLKFYCRGRDGQSVGIADLKNIAVSRYSSAGLPKWSDGVKASVTAAAADGFTVSWPAADGAESYNVYLDGKLAASGVTGTEYMFSGLEHYYTEDEYTAEIEAVNDAGTSVDRLKVGGNTAYDWSSGELDKRIVHLNSRRGGDTEYTESCIPGILVTSKNTKIFYGEHRLGRGGDRDAIDIVAYRSTDNGDTLSAPMLLAEHAETAQTCNNPVMVEDQTGRIHLLYCVNYGECSICGTAATSACTHGAGVFHRYSDDDGVTWSAPENISDSTGDDHNAFALGPGHGICLQDGTLVIAAWTVLKSANVPLNSHRPSVVTTIYSTDNGVTWQRGENIPNPNGLATPSETTLVQLDDGRVMANSRIDYGSKYRAVSYSNTGFSGWSDMVKDYELPDATCTAGLAKYDFGGVSAVLLANCANAESTTRIKLTVSATYDGGETWPVSRMLTPGVSGMCDINVDQNGYIYVLCADQYYDGVNGISIMLYRLTYDWLTAEAASTMRSLTVTEKGGAENLIAFSADTGVYTIEAKPGDTLTITPTALIPESAAITVNGVETASGTGVDWTVSDAQPSAEISITDGTYTKTYKVLVKIPEQLVLHYDGEDIGSDGTVEDLTVYRNDGAATDVSLNETDFRFGSGSLKMAESGGSCVVAYPQGIAMAKDDFTVSMWVRSTYGAAEQVLFWYGGVGGGNDQLWLRQQNGGTIRLLATADGKNSEILAENVLESDKWQFVTVTRTGRELTLYVDGVSVGTAEMASAALSCANNQLRLFQKQDGTYSFTGSADEIRLFNYALNPDEIRALMTENAIPDKVTLSFDVQGLGTAPAAQTIRWSTAPAEPDAPEAAGYIFGGWYQDPVCTRPYDFTEVLKESSMAYACWIRCDHSGSSARPTCSQTAVCTVCGGEIPAAGHDFRMIERVEPTETEDGRLVYVCFQCGSYYAHVLPAGGSCVSEQFTDVDRSAWYHSAVDFVVGAGLMDGVRSDAFEPAGTVTRAMITVILYRLSGVTWTGKASDFTDVPENIWYAQAVAWAESCGVAEGVGGGRFAPDEPVTREQLAAMLYRYARLNGYDVNGAAVLDGFTDAGDVSAWAKAAVRWAVKNGLLEGSTGNRLLPGDGAQRAEAAALIQRFAETFILYD